MRPKRFPGHNTVYSLPGGNEDNDLFAYVEDGSVTSHWELNDAEREAIAKGARVALCVEMEPTPPVRMAVVEDVEEKSFQVESLEARARRLGHVYISVSPELVPMLGEWTAEASYLRLVPTGESDLIYLLELRPKEEE